MNWKTWVPLVLAVALGLLAMKVARDVLARNRTGPSTPGGTQIVVANKDLPAGAVLTAADVGLGRMLGEINSQSVFSNVSDLEGRVATTPLVNGMPVLETQLAPKGTGGGLQALIPAGMRAITLEINEFSGVAGFLTPGCRVDVVSTINGEAGETVSRSVVQNVKVQAVGTCRPGGGETAEPAGNSKSVTLIATLKEAEAIELAVATGRPRLVLRGSQDRDTSVSEGVTVVELRRGTGMKQDRLDPFAATVEPVVNTKPATQPWETKPQLRQRQISIIRGGVESQSVIDDPVPAGPKWLTTAGTEELPSDEEN